MQFTFTCRVAKVEDTRASRNPRPRGEYVRARKATVDRFLARLRRALAENRVEILPSAREEAMADFGFSEEGIVVVLRSLRYQDFVREEASHHAQHAGNLVWLFDFRYAHGPGPVPEIIYVRVVITEAPRWYVIKFHVANEQ